MDAPARKKHNEEEKQAAIRRQIAALQAQLNDPQSGSGTSTKLTSSPKRKRPPGNLLAPRTPSPKKRKVDDKMRSKQHRAPLPGPSFGATKAPVQKKANTNAPREFLKPAPSTVISKLADISKAANRPSVQDIVSRTSAFSEQAAAPTVQEESSGLDAPKRDDRLAIVEEIPCGPAEHKAPFDDPKFLKLEPNSGIRLSSRSIPHDEFQNYLVGRYYLSPSKLYSVIRLLPNQQGYDVPVDGDWVTIAVVAERGPLKYTRAPVGVRKEDLGAGEEKDDTLDDLDNPPKPTNPNQWKGKGKGKQEYEKPSGKKYINLKLIDFGCRTSKSDSTTGGKSVIRGDAFLSLLLFESDRVDEMEEEEDYGKKTKRKIYVGGSRGAFEKMSKLKEGSVVALLNPKVLKPFQRSGDAPHRTDNILAITPESLDSTLVLGHSMDLGSCTAIKRDGKSCGNWCDKRVGDVCEYHIQNAVQRRRANRPEFSAGTSGMTNNAKKKSAYDPSRKWGLAPNPDQPGYGAGATYVVSGHVVNGGSLKSLFINESYGRDAQARAARKLSEKDADRQLERLLKKDKVGTQAVIAAREFGKKQKSEGKKESAKAGKKRADASSTTNDKGKGKEKSDVNLDSSSESDSEGGVKKNVPQRNAYTAELIKTLGFDPTGRDGGKPTDATVQKKLDVLAALQSNRKEIDLSRRPGMKPTTVYPPESYVPKSQPGADDEDPWEDSSDDGLVIEG